MHTNKTLILAITCLTAGAGLSAVVSSTCDDTAVDISANYRTVFNTGASFRAGSIRSPGQEAVNSPLFWFDAGERTGWEIDDTLTVSKITNKGTADRYLTCAHDEIIVENYRPLANEAPLWYNRLSKISGPVLRDGDENINGPYLDFGVAKSYKALWFDPVRPDGADESCTLSNQLHGVGTVIGVYRSNGGSGCILGGSPWRRWSGYTASTAGTNLLESVVGTYADKSVLNGEFWSDAEKLKPAESFWTCEWEVVAMNPTSAALTADGVGCGNPNKLSEDTTCGGQAIAELIVYDRVLEDSEIQAVIGYLESKWLKGRRRGRDGRADISWIIAGGVRNTLVSSSATGFHAAPGIEIPVEVPAGEELRIGRMNGGRAPAGNAQTLRKTGEGPVSFGEARDYGGEIALEEGALHMELESVPTALPAEAKIRFDFSDAGTVTKDENGLVSAVANLGTADCALSQPDETLRPEFTADLPVEGLNALDFKNADNHEADVSGRYMVLTEAQPLSTVLAVVDTRIYAAAHVLDGPFLSAKSSTTYARDWRDGTYSRFGARKAWVNGLPVDTGSEHYETPGFNVVAFQSPVGTVSRLGGVGGLRICEVVGYTRWLSEREILDASAFLSKKWLRRSTPGYSDDSGTPDIQTVIAKAGTEIRVAEGSSAKVARLVLDGPVEKTGRGTLEVVAGDETAALLTVVEGTVRSANAGDVTGDCEIAAHPSVHLDASRTELVKTHVQNGTNFVWCWEDSAGRISAVKETGAIDYSCPWLNTDESALCNGLAVVDFGPYAPSWSQTVGCQIGLSRTVHNLRAVYFVLGSQAGGGNVLGSGAGAALDSYLGGHHGDFYRNTDGSTSPLFNKACPAVKSGELFINGVKASSAASYVPNGGYELVELHTASGCRFDRIGNGFEYYVHGGFRLGELIVFERPLTEREKIATRNYLLKKWLGRKDSELTPLPEATVPDPVSVRSLAPRSAAETVSVSDDLQAKTLAGGGTVEVEAGKTLEASDLSAFTGVLKVRGELILSGAAPAADPVLAQDGRILHLDAAHGLETVTNDDGSVSVSAWNSKLGDGFTALPGPAKDGLATNNPSCLPYELDMKPVVRMSADGQQHFLFCRDGMTNRLENIKSAFWVIGSQEGGGMLLGGGRRNVTSGAGSEYVWHRGGNNAGSVYSDPLVNDGHALDSITSGSWRINGAGVNPRNTGLSGGYDVVSYVIPEDAQNIPNADGLAFDGRYIGTSDYDSRVGRQRLAELIVYDRRLSEAEVEQTESYLSAKWGFSRVSATNCAEVTVAEGATLVCGAPQYIDKLSGPGSVEGDVTVRRFTADALGGAELSVAGTLGIAPNPTIEITNLPSGPFDCMTLEIARADGFSGTENLADAVITGNGTVPARLRVSNGALLLVLGRRGMEIRIR